MLVITRKPGERLMIGESVEVTVLEVRGEQVSLGISAPREIPIHREELLERIRRENRRAAELDPVQLHAMGARLRARAARQVVRAGAPAACQDVPPMPSNGKDVPPRD